MIFNTKLTKAKAIKLYKSNWWKDKTAEQIVKFQLFESRLCMNFSDYSAALSEVLDRPVYTHEFAWLDLLQQEYLGKRPKPTLAEVIGLLSQEKLLVIAADSKRDHGFDELTEDCDGAYDGNNLRMRNCSCKKK